MKFRNKGFFGSVSQRDRWAILWLSLLLIILEVGGRVYTIYFAPARRDFTLTVVYDTVSVSKPRSNLEKEPGRVIRNRPVRAQTKNKPKPTVLLNEFDTLAWEALPGIGPVYARRILKFRNLLGGYAEKAQLNEVYGLDTSQSWYGLVIQDFSELDSLRINTDTVTRLYRHPYIHPKLAWEWIRYREKVGKIKSLEEVGGGYLMTDSLFRKIAPYLSLQ